ncbi:unnamed protein product [Cylicocyclus nassatus]|uniref:Uncharacterized protein n=1 Tax=Cylicocyclus nassatus TaxID=53992 RepID=A0AA36GKE6_CYLNA|nr:unnamed protein product [Cylicocyclus nassatus]
MQIYLAALRATINPPLQDLAELVVIASLLQRPHPSFLSFVTSHIVTQLAHASCRMWFYITIGILFGYTIVLVVFFMGWCTLAPTWCHPRKGIPFSAVKSPRRNTKYVEIDSVSSSIYSTSLDMPEPLPQKCAYANRGFDEKKHSLYLPAIPHKYNDYLHPKYSLPPVKIDIGNVQWEFEQLLRTPGRAVRTIVSKNPP